MIIAKSPGAYHLSQKIRKSRFKFKCNSNFPQNPFRKCPLSSEVVLFFRSERNDGNLLVFGKCYSFQSVISRKQLQMVSAISFGFFTILGKPLQLFSGYPNRIILAKGKHPSFLKRFVLKCFPFRLWLSNSSGTQNVFESSVFETDQCGR